MKTTKTKIAKEPAPAPWVETSNGSDTDSPAGMPALPGAARLPDPSQIRVPVRDCIVGDGFNRADKALNEEFRRDIAQRGVLMPLIVRDNGSKFEVFAGARRLAAAEAAGLAEVPVSVYPCDTPTEAMLELRLIENLQREGLTALDEAQQFQEALAGGSYGTGKDAVRALAGRVGKSVSHVYSRLRLFKLPKKLREAWEKGEVPQSIVELLAALPDEADQLKALEEVRDAGDSYQDRDGKWKYECLSVRATRSLLDQEYRAQLGEAGWDLADGTLVPAAGPCTTCPHRGGPGNATGESRSDVCTRRLCYQGKRTAFVERMRGAATAEGKEVLAAAICENAFRYGTVASVAGYTAAADKPWQDKGARTYQALLAKQEPKPAYLVHPQSGKLIKLYRNQGLNEALVKAGHAWAKPAGEHVSKEDRAKEKAKQGRQEAFVERLVGAVMKAVESPKLSERVHANLWAFLFNRRIHEDGGPDEKYFNRRNIARSSLDSITKLSPRSDLHLAVVRGECIEHTLMDWSGNYLVEDVEFLAELVGVDAKAIEKEVEAAFAKVKPPAPAPKPETRNGKLPKAPKAKPAKHAKHAKGKGKK